MNNTDTHAEAFPPVVVAAIEHLSREVETHSSSAFSFRSRIAFTLWVGPYLMLGTLVVVSREAPAVDIGNWAVSLLVIAGLVYLLLGYLAGWIERRYWKQVEDSRKAIAALVKSCGIDNPELRQALESKRYQRMTAVYGVVFFLILISFIVALALATGSGLA